MTLQSGAEHIAQERERQKVLGYSLSHDLELNGHKTLRRAAQALLKYATDPLAHGMTKPPAGWPASWEGDPGTPWNATVKAGALLAAALDAFDLEHTALQLAEVWGVPYEEARSRLAQAVHRFEQRGLM